MKKINNGIVWIVGFLVLFFSIVLIIDSIPYTYELEGSCNSGRLRGNLEGYYENEPYNVVNYKKTNGTFERFKFIEHDIEFLPKSLKVTNIEDINCNFKLKGAIPYKFLSKNFEK